jgi:hypothetical protein
MEATADTEYRLSRDPLAASCRRGGSAGRRSPRPSPRRRLTNTVPTGILFAQSESLLIMYDDIRAGTGLAVGVPVCEVYHAEVAGGALPRGTAADTNSAGIHSPNTSMLSTDSAYIWRPPLTPNIDSPDVCSCRHLLTERSVATSLSASAL